MGPFWWLAAACFAALVWVFVKFAHSYQWYCCCSCVCVWMNCGLNIVMNFCCWFIYYYDCDSMERPFHKLNCTKATTTKKVSRKFHQHCLLLLHTLSSSVVVQLLFHSNNFHFIKFHWNCSIFTFNFSPFFPNRDVHACPLLSTK